MSSCRCRWRRPRNSAGLCSSNAASSCSIASCWRSRGTIPTPTGGCGIGTPTCSRRPAAPRLTPANRTVASCRYRKGAVVRILVLGAGAVGGYFGGRLAAAGGDVTFLVRERRAAELAADGLVIKSPCGDAVLRVKTARAGEALAPVDIVLLCCKAYDLDSAMESIAPAVGTESAVLPVLNGLNHLDRLDRRFGSARVLGGVAQIAATIGAGGRIEQLSKLHRIIFGERDGRRSERAAGLAVLMKRANFDSALSEAILLEMWEKFVLLAT